MSFETMRGLTSGHSGSGGFVHAARMLFACTAATALVLLPFAIGRAGLAGPVGVAVAAAVCLACGLMSAAVTSLLGTTRSPLIAMLVGMAVRMAPPLFICLILAAQRTESGRYLAFICYLLAFYFATLAVETWLAVKRTANTSNHLN
jgi:hypothetical protein